MKTLANVLIALAVIGFILAIIFKLANLMVLGLGPQSAFRFTVGCLLFALSFILMEIRDRKA